jgi:hypothetical protein
MPEEWNDTGAVRSGVGEYRFTLAIAVSLKMLAKAKVLLKSPASRVSVIAKSR